jgi:hypothetical protein
MYGKMVTIEINNTKFEMFVAGIPAMTDKDFEIRALQIIRNEVNEKLKVFGL